MNSPGHRANILDPRFTDIGVGYVAGTATSQYRTYWTQLFIQKP
ncbi:Cysteine-rich secretory protein family protein [Paenibacillus macquariensis]|uniref:Cysteine-rich secretory protein family protein n=2 Tax=Paenibacillus macquariensis TaxID=948756 RepID=A0ABY1KAL0_9BACL|nr:Cysteine-rich secretory protein family protein [Paenibacillus macquariensis]